MDIFKEFSEYLERNQARQQAKIWAIRKQKNSPTKGYLLLVSKSLDEAQKLDCCKGMQLDRYIGKKEKEFLLKIKEKYHKERDKEAFKRKALQNIKPIYIV